MGELIATEGLRIKGFVLSKVGLTAESEPTYEEWQKAVEMLRFADGAIRWWIGDWLNFGEWKWGEKYWEATVEFGMGYQTLADCKWVSGAIQFSRRRENLSWSHHQEVAGLEESDQDRLLSAAESCCWTRADLREQVRALKRLGKPQPEFDLNKELGVIFSLLCQRRDTWPEENQTAFSGHLRNLLSQMDYNDGNERGNGKGSSITGQDEFDPE